MTKLVYTPTLEKNTQELSIAYFSAVLLETSEFLSSAIWAAQLVKTNGNHVYRI
jgi:hypothetical protein